MRLASLDVSLVQHAFNAAPVVNVIMGIEHSDNRFLWAVLVVEFEARFSRRGREQWINDDQACVTLDNRHVGQIHAANLIKAIGYLEQTMNVV